LGLEGFGVLDVEEQPDELVITIESTADEAGCEACGVQAVPHERRRVPIRDKPTCLLHRVAFAPFLSVGCGGVAGPRPSTALDG
jgi:hypothetical protein